MSNFKKNYFKLALNNILTILFIVSIFSLTSCKGLSFSSKSPAQRYRAEHASREFSFYKNWDDYWKQKDRQASKKVKGPIKNKF